ncbi:MAG: DUF4398 domain-containing protein [Myxococcota bacterium]
MRTAGWLIPLVLLAGAGCGPVIHTVNVVPASRAVEQAREARAAEHAPYEYYYAKAHLEEARDEASEAHYEDSIRFAETAEEYGVKARDLARRRFREMGR